jgi:hypothetical protein
MSLLKGIDAPDDSLDWVHPFTVDGSNLMIQTVTGSGSKQELGKDVD